MTKNRFNSMKHLQQAILNASGSGLKEAVSIAVRSGNSILMGQRRDTMLWTLPGGGVEGNETSFQAAVRELREESGLGAKNLNALASCYVDGGVYLHCFDCDYNVDINRDQLVLTSEFDPDQEVAEWKWIDTRSQEFKHILQNLQHPKNETLRLLRLQ